MNLGNLPSDCRKFAALHAKGAPLLLINTWGVVSARTLIDAGVPAVATSSGALAAARGFGDGERLPLDDLLRVVERIATLSDTPVTADLESGYGASSAQVATSVRRIIDVSAVGINIEDGLQSARRELADKDLQADPLAAARAAVPLLFVNARIDTYLPGGTGESALAETLRRADRYRQAGASGIFVPGVADLEAIKGLADATAWALNVLAQPGSPAARRWPALPTPVSRE